MINYQFQAVQTTDYINGGRVSDSQETPAAYTNSKLTP
jgi:hypothetical protein